MYLDSRLSHKINTQKNFEFRPLEAEIFIVEVGEYVDFLRPFSLSGDGTELAFVACFWAIVGTRKYATESIISNEFQFCFRERAYKSMFIEKIIYGNWLICIMSF